MYNNAAPQQMQNKMATWNWSIEQKSLKWNDSIGIEFVANLNFFEKYKKKEKSWDFAW